MTPRGSRSSSGGRNGGRLLDPAAEGVDVVPQEGSVGAHDQQSMMSKRTWISPSGELAASQEAAAISRSPRGGYPSRHDGFWKHTACRRAIAVSRTHEAGRSAWRRSTSPYAWRGRRGTTRRSSSRSSASAPPRRSACSSSFRVRKNDTGTIFQHERLLVMAGKGDSTTLSQRTKMKSNDR